MLHSAPVPEVHVMEIPSCATQNMLNCSNAHGLIHDLRAVVEVCGAGGPESEQGVSAADAYAGECDWLSGFVSCCI